MKIHRNTLIYNEYNGKCTNRREYNKCIAYLKI